MFRAFIMMIAGFIIGMILSENAQIVRHSVPKDDGNFSGNINQFVFILGVGNSSNVFEVSTGDTKLPSQQKPEDKTPNE